MNENAIPSKFELLMKITEAQLASSKAFRDANLYRLSNRPSEADECYGRFKTAGEEHLRLSLLHNAHHPQPVDIIPIVNTLLNGMSVWADIIDSSGMRDRAKAVRDEMLELSRTYLSHDGEAEVKRGLAASLILEAKFNEAFIALYSARDAFECQGNTLKLARTTLDMVDLLQWLGDYERALNELKHASKLVAERLQGRKPSQQDLMMSMLAAMTSISSGKGDGTEVIQIGELYRIATELDYYQGLISKANGDFAEAQAAFNKVLPEYQKLNVGPAIEFQFCSIKVMQKEYAEALELIVRIKPVFEKDARLLPKLAALLRLEAECLSNTPGKSAEALACVRRASDELQRHYDPDLLWRTQWTEARILSKIGDNETSLQMYERSVATIGELRKSSLGHRLDSLYLKDKLGVFTEAMTLAVRLSRGDACACFMDAVKSRGLAAVLSLSSQKRGTLESEDPKFAALDRISSEMDSLEYRGYRDGNDSTNRAKRDKLLIEREQLLEEIRISDPRWRSLSLPATCEMAKLQAFAGKTGHSIISLYLDNKCITGVLITPGLVDAYELEIKPLDWEKLVLFAENIGLDEPDSTMYDVSIKFKLEAIHFIPAGLLEKAAAFAGLVIIPHGLLHLLPWSGLVWQGKRLFEYAPVSVMPNMSCIPLLSVKTDDRPKVAIFGPPDYKNLLPALEKADGEVRSIYAIYGNKRVIATPYLGNDANVKAFDRLLDHSDASGAILHVACHGMMEPLEPMNSGLLAADAKIDASEIARKRIFYNEVVLSACNTGWRATQVRDVALCGDDIVGIPGAFLEAGVKSVLVSISKADDNAAAEFMVRYHKARSVGESPMKALQKAQKSMLYDPEFEPYQWVGFTMYGCR